MSSTNFDSERTLFLTAGVEQYEFARDELREHAESQQKRSGFRLVRVAGRAVPDWVRLAYVVGRSDEGDYVYVVVWRTPDAESPETYDVASEAEAKQEIVRALRALLRSEEPQ